MNDEAALACMIADSVAHSEASYARGLEAGYARPCVILLDLRDATARAAAEAIQGVARTRGTFIKYALEGEVPITRVVNEPDRCADLLEPISPRVAELLRSTPPEPGHFYVVAIGCGKVKLVQQLVPEQ